MFRMYDTDKNGYLDQVSYDVDDDDDDDDAGETDDDGGSVNHDHSCNDDDDGDLGESDDDNNDDDNQWGFSKKIAHLPTFVCTSL